MEIWSLLEPWPGDVPHGPPLGYRGCALHGPDRLELHAYGGVAIMNVGGDPKAQIRSDVRRQLEKAILATAPPSLIPATALEQLK